MLGVSAASRERKPKESAAPAIRRAPVRPRAPVPGPRRPSRRPSPDQRRVDCGAAVEAEPGQQRQDHLEVEAEGPDQGHQRQRHRQLGGRADVAQAAADRAPLPRGRRAPRSCAGSIRQQGDDHPAEGERVDREAGRDADRGDQDRRERRADDAGGVDDDAVEADRVDDPVGADHLDHEALPGGVVDRVDGAADEDQHEDHPRSDDPGDASRANSPRAGIAISDWVAISRRRFGKRSASRPPQAPKSSIGRNWRAVSSRPRRRCR